MKKIGTPGFLAPEVFKSKYYDQKVDVYSIGILLYFFIYSRMPFGNEFNEVKIIFIRRLFTIMNKVKSTLDSVQDSVLPLWIS